jgi:glutathione S-transferase
MRLHRFPYSCYARYVQAALDLAGVPCEIVDVPFGDRGQLAALTRGYIQVPVLEKDDGAVLTDSRRILETLVREDARLASLVPVGEAGPVWAYADWIMSTVEDVAFRLASPFLARRFTNPFERALFVFIKERKYGAGCIEEWKAGAGGLFARLKELLEPTARTLEARPFLMGTRPTLADAALYGQMAMLDIGAPDRVAALTPSLLAWKLRLEEKMGPPPYGRVARAHRGRADIERVFAERGSAPRTGLLEHIVVRTAMHERACPSEVTLDPTQGLVGDRWLATNGKPKAQLSIMDVRVAHALADREDWCLAGDNLFVDMDLSESALAPGVRLRVGGAALEITDEPHLGCRKFSARFGAEALLWVNEKASLPSRRRRVYARVLEGGAVRVGDAVRPLTD